MLTCARIIEQHFGRPGRSNLLSLSRFGQRHWTGPRLHRYAASTHFVNKLMIHFRRLCLLAKILQRVRHDQQSSWFRNHKLHDCRDKLNEQDWCTNKNFDNVVL